MYLSGDREASLRAEQLCEVQREHENLLAAQLAKHGNRLVEAMHAATTADHLFSFSWLHNPFASKANAEVAEPQTNNAQDETELEQKVSAVHKELLDVQERLSNLSGSGDFDAIK